MRAVGTLGGASPLAPMAGQQGHCLAVLGLSWTLRALVVTESMRHRMINRKKEFCWACT